MSVMTIAVMHNENSDEVVASIALFVSFIYKSNKK